MGSNARSSQPDAGRKAWEIEFTPEAERWYMGLGPEDTRRMAAAFDALERSGPGLARPRVDTIKSSRHHSMKELRSVGGHLRALFAFDSRRRAVVLLGGDKTNDWQGWYKRHIPLADKLYDKHVRTNGREGPWPGRDGPSSDDKSR